MLGVWAKRHGWSHGDLKVSRGHYVKSLYAISTNGNGKVYVQSGSTYGLTYYDQFFFDYPRRALPVRRPPATTKSLHHDVGAPLSQDWSYIRDSLRQEYNKIGNPAYRYVLLNKFRQFHTAVRARDHFWAWIRTLTRAYHNSTSAQKFNEANWAVPMKWIVGSDNDVAEYYWIGGTRRQPKFGRDGSEMLSPRNQLKQFHKTKWQIPSPQSGPAMEDTVKQIKKLPSIVKDIPDVEMGDWERPDNILDPSFKLAPLLGLPSRLRLRILKMVLIVKRSIRPRRCEQAIGSNFKPTVNIYCPCRACCSTRDAPSGIKSVYAVAATCRTLREQSLPIYYTNNKFRFYVGNQTSQELAMVLQSFFLIIGRQTARYIRYIIWEDVNDPQAFEEVLAMHSMKELSGVTTVRFVRLPTETVECRRLAPASVKEASPCFLALKHFLDTRYLLQNNFTNIEIIFPTVPAADPNEFSIHDIENCGRCRSHRKFFADIKSWFYQMQ